MNAKHTPGPWEAVGNLVRSPMVQPQGLSKGVQIAECRDAYFLSHTEESKANARLIAAAPELLEALQEMVSLVEMVIPFDGPQQRKARAAITKATGDAQ